MSEFKNELFLFRLQAAVGTLQSLLCKLPYDKFGEYQTMLVDLSIDLLKLGSDGIS